MILSVHNILRTRLAKALRTLYKLDADAVPAIGIKYPPDRMLGDLAVTVAFELARTLRKPPKLIAQELIAAIGDIEGITKSEATPNGYINLHLDRRSHLQAAFGQPDSTPSGTADMKTVVEHTAINPNKAAHVGHLRNSALGDTLVRLLRFQGHHVETQNYIDDTGVQVADVVVGFIEIEQMNLEAVKHLADTTQFDYYCWDLYARVTSWYEEDPTRLEKRTQTLHALERGKNDTATLAHFIAERIVRLHLKTMDRLNIEYDLLSWEGDILQRDFWATTFEILKTSGAISYETSGKQTGCWIMPITDGTDNEASEAEEEVDSEKEARAKVIVRSNGIVTYVGKDIAYQFWKFGLLTNNFNYKIFSEQRSGKTLWTTISGDSSVFRNNAVQPDFGNATAVYNVIDTRQSYLQRLLQQALHATGHKEESSRSIHFSYEMVALSNQTAKSLGYETDDERPFVEVSGRKGLGVKADDLLDLVTKAAKEQVVTRNTELTKTEAHSIATAIGVAAIRYFMIKYSRVKVIAFDLNEALSFEGESGPYLQYAALRSMNILDKLHSQYGTTEDIIIGKLSDIPNTVFYDQNNNDLWNLVLESSRLDEIVDQAIRTLELSVLAKYSFTLAQHFNAFYHKYPVIKEEEETVRLYRAAAVLYFKQQITQALHLIGCTVPHRM
tara:strand:- start:15569 stop:17578 length:2010 start_codon:yes stop_codon:yes gene_type:complete